MTSQPSAANEERLLRMLDSILEEAKERGITMRVMGALAFRIHCPKYRHVWYELDRKLTDIDLVAYGKDAEKISRMMSELKYSEVLSYRLHSGGRRRLFLNEEGTHVDVFFDELHMAHDIKLRGRLEIDYPTIPLVDLLLEKMQIVDIDPKDLVDTVVLLREHNVGDGDEETINADYLAALCASDWGLWKTVTTNLNRVKDFVVSAQFLSDEDKNDVVSKVNVLLEAIEKKPKSRRWRMRAMIGEKVRWYRSVSRALDEA
jgi:hypothetical protein